MIWGRRSNLPAKSSSELTSEDFLVHSATADEPRLGWRVISKLQHNDEQEEKNYTPVYCGIDSLPSRAQTRLQRTYKMKKLFTVVLLCFAVAAWAAEKSTNEWAMNASIIEACSCPMFCQCYFNTSPAGHPGHGDHGGGEHFCKFNNAFKVNHGHAGNVKLDGAKFWVAGDLGSDFSKG